MKNSLPWRAQSRKIILKNYIGNIFVGIYEHEKTARQRVGIDIELDIEPSQCTGMNSAVPVLDYDFLRDGIEEIIASQHFELQENLCEKLLDLSFCSAHVHAAKVSTRKLDVYPNSDFVGITVFAVREAVS